MIRNLTIVLGLISLGINLFGQSYKLSFANSSITIDGKFKVDVQIQCTSTNPNNFELGGKDFSNKSLIIIQWDNDGTSKGEMDFSNITSSSSVQSKSYSYGVLNSTNGSVTAFLMNYNPSSTLKITSNPITLFSVYFTLGKGTNNSDYANLSFGNGNINDINNNSISASKHGTLENVQLPVELGDFTLKKVTTGIELNWLTYSEINNRGFEIQYSKDGENFTAVGWVNGIGTSNTTNYYSFTYSNNDKQTVFYRLKQIDYDGKFNYSNIISTKDNDRKTSFEFDVYPNPSSNYINIKAEHPFKILNSLGSIIYTSSSNDERINVKHWHKGNYVIQVNGIRNEQMYRHLFQVI